MKLFKTSVYSVSKVLNAVGAGAMIFVMFFIVCDVIMRKFLNSPILGSYEIVEYAMVVMVFLALAYTQVEKGHISIELIFDIMPQKVKALLDVITNLIAFFFWGTISFTGFLQAAAQFHKKIVSATLLIPVWPFAVITDFHGV
jgi:TRAP-type C4-dicarboxylate transport system permease small subunit